MVHTHSSYATAFAALGRPIPVYLTAIADEFGVVPSPVEALPLLAMRKSAKSSSIPIGDYPAVLLKNHGVFTVGSTAKGGGQGGCHGRQM